VISDSFAGDAFYRPASTNASSISFAFLPGGSFVIGDQSAQPDTAVMFWGAQWAVNNRLSGGMAPDSFKGFAESLSSEPPTCGGVAWTSRTGNSSNPPGSVPAYMGVLVSPSVIQSGATISGSAIRIVVVKTDPGYAGHPGQAGTGVVVAQFCN